MTTENQIQILNWINLNIHFCWIAYRHNDSVNQATHLYVNALGVNIMQITPKLVTVEHFVLPDYLETIHEMRSWVYERLSSLYEEA